MWAGSRVHGCRSLANSTFVDRGLSLYDEYFIFIKARDGQCPLSGEQQDRHEYAPDSA